MGVLDELVKRKKQLTNAVAKSAPVRKFVNSKQAQAFTSNGLTKAAESGARKIRDFGAGVAKTATDWAGGQLGKALGQSLAAGYESKTNQKIQRQQVAQDKIIMDRVKQVRQSGNEQEAQRLLGVMNNPKYNTTPNYQDTVKRYQQGQRDAIVGGTKTAVTAATLPSTLSGQSTAASLKKPLSGSFKLAKTGMSAKNLTGALTHAGISAAGDALTQKLTTGKVNWKQVGSRAGEGAMLEGVMRPVYAQSGRLSGKLISRVAGPQATGQALTKIGQTAAPKLSELVKQGAIRGAVSGALATVPASAVHSGLKTLETADFDLNKSTLGNIANMSKEFARNYLHDLPGQVATGAAYGGIFGAVGGIGEYKQAQKTLVDQAKMGKITPADMARMRRQALQTLGADENATPAELEKLHKKLVLQTHPDRNGGDDTAFRQMQEAYEFLTQGKPMASTYTSMYEPQKADQKPVITDPNAAARMASGGLKEQLEAAKLAEANKRQQMGQDYVAKLKDKSLPLQDIHQVQQHVKYKDVEKMSHEKVYSIGKEIVSGLLNKNIIDAQGNKVYLSPGKDTVDDYVLHFLAGKDNKTGKINPPEKIRNNRLLSLTLIEQTIKYPLVITKQTDDPAHNSRKLYFGIYQTSKGIVANEVVVGTKPGEEGRIITQFVAMGDGKRKSTVYSELRKRIREAENIEYSVELSGHSRSTTVPDSSLASTGLPIVGKRSIPQQSQNVKSQNVNKLEDGQEIAARILAELNNHEEPRVIKIADKSESLPTLKQAYKQYGPDFYDHLNKSQQEYYDKLLAEAPRVIDDTYLDPVTGEKWINHSIYRDTQGRSAVEIDERYLEGKNPDEYRKLIKNKVMKKFAGKSYAIGDTEYNALVGKNTAGKLSMPSNRQQTVKNYRNKGESAGNLDEIIQSLHNVRVEQNLKTDTQPNIDKYIKGEVEVKIGNKTYYPTMSFRVYDDGNVVAHDVVFGETGPGLTPGWIGAATSVFPRNSRQRGSVKDANILAQLGENVNSQNVNNPTVSVRPINYLNDNRGVPIGEYNQVPSGWSVIADSRIAPPGYTAILDNRPGGTGMKGLIKNENLGSVGVIKIAGNDQNRAQEVMDALDGSDRTSEEEWASILGTGQTENKPNKSTAASVLDPIEMDETEIPDPDDNLELKKQNLDWYRDRNKADQNLAKRAKTEISQLLNPLNSLSERDRASFDAWRAKELQAATEAQYLAREWTARFGNPDDKTAWAITQYIQNPTQAEAERLGITEYVKEHEQDFKDLRAFFEDLHEQQKLRTAEKFGHLENYFPQKWHNTPQEVKKVEDELLKQSGQVRQEHMERRIIPDYKTGVKLGLTPKYTHFAPLIAEYYVKANRAIDNYELQHDLMARGLLQTGKKEGKFWNLVTADSIPSGGKKLYAPQAIAKTLDNIWGKGTEGWAPLAVTAKLNSGLQNIILSGGIPGTPLNSFVYGQVIKEATGGNFAAVKNLAQTFVGEDIDTFMKEHRQTIKRMNAQGVRIDPGWDYRTEYANLFVKPLDNLVQADGKLEKTLVGLDMVNDKLDSAFGDATFKNFMPRLNVEIFEKAYQEAMGLGKSETEAAKFAGDTLKNWRGLVDPYARNRKVQQAIDSIFFAPQYREGMINFWTNLAKSVASGDVLRSDKAGSKYMRNFIIGSAITYGVMNVANYALNGRFCWQNKPGNKFSVEIPEKYLPGGEAGRALRAPLLPSTSTLPRNAIEFGLAALEGDGDTMRRLAAGYFGMGVKLPLELIGNQDFYGNQIRDPDSSLLNQAGQITSYIAGNYSHPYVGAAINYLTGRKNALESAAQVLELPLYGSRSTETANLSKKEYETYQQLAKSGQDAGAFAQAANAAKKQKEAAKRQESSTTSSDNDKSPWWRALKFWDREPIELTLEERRTQIKNRIKVDDRSINSDDLEFYYLQDALDLPDESQLDRAKRNKKLFALYDKLDDDEYLDDAQRQNLRQKIMQETGMGSEQMVYYQKAKAAGNNHLKYLTVMDDLAQARIDANTPEGHEKLLEYLIDARKTVGEKILASDGVIGELYERGLLSKNESKWLKALEWDEEVGDWKQTNAAARTAGSSSGSGNSGKKKGTNPYASLAKALRQNSKTTRVGNFAKRITIKAPTGGGISIARPDLSQSAALTIGRPNIDPKAMIRIAS